MSWMLEIFLEMHKCARRLDKTFKKIVVNRVGVQPELLEHVVRFVIALLVPALKIGAVIGMTRDIDLGRIDIFAHQFGDQPRNPLAFAHEEPNLIAAQTMGKPACISFPEDERARHRFRVKE